MSATPCEYCGALVRPHAIAKSVMVEAETGFHHVASLCLGRLKARAETAEKRAREADLDIEALQDSHDVLTAKLREAEAKLETWRVRVDVAEQREREARETTIAGVVAWLRAHRNCGLAQSYASAIERGEWAAPW